MDTDVLALGIVWYAVLLLSLTVHEAAHAWAALRGGDPTAHHDGQVSLDPCPHVRREPFGTVFVPIFFYLWSVLQGRPPWMIGWASTPYDPAWAFIHPRRAGWMALAGPASNFLLAALAGLAIRIGLATGSLEPGYRALESVAIATTPGLAATVATFLSLLFSLNLLLGVFNLLPFPPLDGAGVLNLFVSEPRAQRLMHWMTQPALRYGGFLAAWFAIRPLFGPVFDHACDWLYAGI